MKRNSLTIITANRLTDGAVLYLGPAGDWSERLDGSWLAESREDEERGLALGLQAEADLIVVGAYATAVERLGDRLAPVSQRERIRANGPTVPADAAEMAEPRTPQKTARRAA